MVALKCVLSSFLTLRLTKNFNKFLQSLKFFKVGIKKSAFDLTNRYKAVGINPYCYVRLYQYHLFKTACVCEE